jgi:hypothetical protein
VKILVVNHLRNETKEFETFSLEQDESNDTSDNAQLLIVNRSITEHFAGVELASLKNFHGTTTGEDLFLSVCESMKD